MGYVMLFLRYVGICSFLVCKIKEIQTIANLFAENIISHFELICSVQVLVPLLLRVRTGQQQEKRLGLPHIITRAILYITVFQ